MKTCSGEMSVGDDGRYPAFAFPDIPRENRARIYYDYKRGSHKKSCYIDGDITAINDCIELIANDPAYWHFTYVLVVFYYGKILHWDINSRCWWVSSKLENYFFATPIVPYDV